MYKKLLFFFLLSFIIPLIFADEPGNAGKSFSFSELGQKAAEKVDSNSLGIKPVGNGAEIVCKLQAIEATVKPTGISIKSTSEAEGCGSFSMKVAGVGCVNDKLSPPSSDAKVAVSEKCVKTIRPEIVEEYNVSGDGIRQDFIAE